MWPVCDHHPVTYTVVTIHSFSRRCYCGLSVSAHSHHVVRAYEERNLPVHASPGSLGAPAGGRGTPPPQPSPGGAAAAGATDEHWNPAKHTTAKPTDAYGCIDFRGGTQTNKAQVRRNEEKCPLRLSTQGPFPFLAPAGTKLK